MTDPYERDPNGEYPYGQTPYGQSPYAGQPAYGQQYPAPYPQAGFGGPGYGQVPLGPDGQPINDPDNTLAIVGLILGLVLCPPVGLILCWIAQSKSRERGYRNTIAKVGIIVNAVYLGLIVLAVIAYIGIIALVVGAGVSSG